MAAAAEERPNVHLKNGYAVDVLGHSMGGLIVRYAIAEVANHNPDFPPRLIVRNECSEMKAGSDFLTTLEKNGWNPQGTDGTDWTAIGSDDDSWVAADRAVGSSQNRQKDLYFGACHKLWYPAVRTEGSGRDRVKVKQGFEHGSYMHDGSIDGGMAATNLAAYSSGGHCGAPLELVMGERHPMGVAALALASTAH